MPSIRFFNLIIFLGCAGLIATGLYMEHILSLAPCPLCITQRIFIILTGFIGLIACLHNPIDWGRRAYGLLGVIAASAGGYFSAHHVWLQSLPPEDVPACGPGLKYMFEAFPLQEAVSLLLQGDGNCAEVSWTLFSLSIPAWTLVAFIGLALLHFYQIFRKTDNL